jgi:hypothetical protein
MRKLKKPTIASEANDILRQENKKLRKQLKEEVAELERVSGELNSLQALRAGGEMYTSFAVHNQIHLLTCICYLARMVPKTAKGRLAKAAVRARLSTLGIKKMPRQLGRGSRKA